MITDVFAVEPGAVGAYRADGFPDPTGEGFDTVRGRGLDPVALAVLDTMLTGVDFEAALADAVRAPAQEPDLYAGPVVTVLSERVVRVLPAVDEPEVLAADWLATGELGEVTVAAVSAWIEDCADLFRRAADGGLLVCVWNCL